MLLVNALALKPQPWPARGLEGLACLLALAVGLHLPRAFSLLDVLGAVLLARAWWQRRGPGPAALLRPWWPVLVATPLYSLAYVTGMLHWRLWSWSANRADLLHALVLPSLMLLAGLVVGRSGWRLPLRILLSYAVGALLFALLTLVVSRHPWWNATQGFSQAVQVPWGNTTVVNVRSVEQNAIPALVLLPGSLACLAGSGGRWERWRARCGVVLGLLALHALLAFQGRIGVLVLLLTTLPWAGQGLRRLAAGRWRWQLAVPLGTMTLAAAALQHRLAPATAATVGWGQGLCDERISLHLAILRQAWSAPWGGRQLRVPYRLCDGSAAILAPQGGTVTLAHNVVLDVFRDGGVLPALLLLASVLPLLWVSLGGFAGRWRQRSWSWESSFLWGWLVLLLCEWSFQPLLYADGLLYYSSFFVFASMAAGFISDLDAAEQRC